MNTAIRWLIFGLTPLIVLLLALVGLGRLYAFWNARQCEGLVTNIRPAKTDQAKFVESYLVELQTAERQIYLFATSDKQWVMIKPGDYVRVRLYPAPFWRNGSGQWQNGRLLTKLVPPERQEIVSSTTDVQSQTVSRPAVQPSPPPASPPAQTAKPQAAPNVQPSGTNSKTQIAKPPTAQNAQPPASGTHR